MSALWMISLTSVLNRSLLNREYILINVLKSLASIISICNLHVTFLSKITPRYFMLFTNGIFRPFNVMWDSGGRRLREGGPVEVFFLFYSSGRTEERPLPPTVRVLPVLSVAMKLATQQRRSFHCWLRNHGEVFTEPLYSSGHIRHSFIVITNSIMSRLVCVSTLPYHHDTTSGYEWKRRRRRPPDMEGTAGAGVALVFKTGSPSP
jgi:hypothetical protein